MPGYMTRAQYERHRIATNECEEKLAVARKKVGAAAEHGDLSENAEYEAAIEESGFYAGRLEELRSAMVGVTVVDPRNTDEGTVTMGKTVKVRDADSGEENTYHLVGMGVTNTDAGEVSYSAPMGAALIGHKVGDVFDAELPGGTRKFEILDIQIYD